MNPGPPGLPRAEHDMSRALYLAELRAPESFPYTLLSVPTSPTLKEQEFTIRWEEVSSPLSSVALGVP